MPGGLLNKLEYKNKAYKGWQQAPVTWEKYTETEQPQIRLESSSPDRIKPDQGQQQNL